MNKGFIQFDRWIEMVTQNGRETAVNYEKNNV